MGTNYYLKGVPACLHCGRGAQRGLHIGKSSGGWVFLLRIYSVESLLDIEDPVNAKIAEGIHELADWIPLFHTYGVIDERDCDVSAADMIAEITQRSRHGGGPLRRCTVKASPSQWDAENGLCVAHGDGTYDLLDWEFS